MHTYNRKAYFTKAYFYLENVDAIPTHRRGKSYYSYNFQIKYLFKLNYEVIIGN